jgi:hypothetical protein
MSEFWTKELSRNFTKEAVKMPKKQKKLSTSLVIKEMKTKSMLRFYVTPVRMATIMITNNKCSRRCGENGTPYIAVGKVN